MNKMKCVAVSIVLVTAFSSFLQAQRAIPAVRHDGDRLSSMPEWDSRNAAHFMRRAGFSAPLEEIDQLVQQGFLTTLHSMLHPDQIDDSETERIVDEALNSFLPLVEGPEGAREVNEDLLRDVWLVRMIHSRRQLQEKMTYFWHDHFATSVDTVMDVTRGPPERPLMLIQNELLRESSLGNFKDLVHAVARDPAMMVFLDNVSNVVGNPNENWARELMELFTMGLGNFSEKDVQEAARAFTGWTFSREDGSFTILPSLHDDGEKTFLGVTGNLSGDQIIDIIFEQPATAEFIARKIWEFFVYPNPSQEVIGQLGQVFRDSGYEIRPLVSAVFRHPEFFSDRARRALVKSPLEYAIHAMRELGNPTFTFRLRRSMELMGQNLYSPPNVDGYPSGIAWLNTGTALARFSYAAEAFSLRSARSPGGQFPVLVWALPPWLIEIIDRHRLRSADDFISHFTQRLLQGDISNDVQLILEDYMRRGPGGSIGEFSIRDRNADAKILGLVFLLLALPPYQMS